MKPSPAPADDSKQAPARISAAEGWRLWAQSYDAAPNPLLALEFRALARRLDRIPGRVFLDVGCGTGRWMMEAASRGARTFGVDLCPEMLAVAAGKPQLAGCLVQADSRSLPLGDRVADMVLCSFSVGYVEPLDRVMRELCRVTKPGGTVLVSDLHPCGRRAGWHRSFRSGSKVFEIESFHYASEQLVEAGRNAGLELTTILEPRFGEPELLIMQSAGKQELADQVSAIPAVLILEWTRR